LKRDDLLGLEGFAGKKADNLLASIQQSKQQPLARLLTALGIRGVGEVMAGDLTRYYSDLDQLSRATSDDLQLIEGVGPNTAQAIVDWFSRPANRKILDKLRSAGVWPIVSQETTSDTSKGNLAGMTFVVTGTMADFTRQGVKEYIESRGGKVIDSVSKNTSYLVLGENPGSKAEKARSLGIPILSEGALRQLAGE